jgi:uncharacterized SAM-binding protein YcdF (DUF218 family)
MMHTEVNHETVVLVEKKRRWRRVVLSVFLVILLVTVVWVVWVFAQIEYYARHDQAEVSDAIGVFGAAEYDGRPSPVYRARLDHALTLYQHGIAPLVITLGGSGGDAYTEGMVGREYLVSLGIPEANIIAETESRNTEESALRIAVIARANNLRRLVIVSDDTHLFRIHEICAADGLNVLTSPRPQAPIAGKAADIERVMHEIVSYTLWRMHFGSEVRDQR